MATLERIRQRSGLLIIIIGLAMLAFILTDLLGSGQSILRGQESTIVEVNGTAIDINEFSKRLSKTTDTYISNSRDAALRNVTNNQLVAATYNEIVQEEIMKAQYEALGFRVTDEEFVELLKSNPQITQVPAFQDQVTGQFSYAALQRAISQLYDQAAQNPQAAQDLKGWIAFEQSIRPQALQQKYNMAIGKGLYMPTALAKAEYIRNNTGRKANFTGLLYSSIADSTVEVNESDIRQYYNAHKEKYKTENTRSIIYVNFPIEPSSKDKANLSQELMQYNKPQAIFNRADNRYDSLPSFAEAEDDSLFAVQASELPVVQPYYTYDELPVGLDSTFFYAPVGTVRGPYAAGNYYRLSKLSARTTLPDSAKASHILISYAGAERAAETITRTPQEAVALADSLLKVVQDEPGKFEELARTMSDDQVAATDGGNVGWMNKNSGMAEPFKNFALYQPNGTIGKVFTNFGVHLIQVTDQEGANEAIRLTNISMELSPSEATLNDIYNKASSFASSVNGAENFGEVAEQNGYVARPVTRLKDFDENISGIGFNREIVKWTFGEEAKVNDLQVFTNGSSSYVVAVMTEVNEEGYADPMQVRGQIEPEVIKEKKAALLFAKLDEARKAGTDINAIAKSLGRPVSSQSVNYATATLNSYGTEPAVLGYISAMEANSLSENLKGERGVFIATVTEVTPAPEKPSYADEQSRLQNALRPRANTAAYQSLEKGADIVDRRAVFY